MIRALALMPAGNLYSLGSLPQFCGIVAYYWLPVPVFKGISEASGGNGAQNSSSNYPLVQLRSLANEQTIFLPLHADRGWSDTDFTSTSITLMTTSSSGFPIGYPPVTVFTNGIPSQTHFVVGEPPRPRP